MTVTPAASRCEVCRRPGSQDYAVDDGRPRGVLCVTCALDVRRVEDRIVSYRRVLAYIKRWAPRPSAPPLDTGHPED